MNILVVDDEKNIAYAIAQILEEQKWQVTMAYDGQEGLDLALSGYYDVAILDIMLPVMNGFEVVQKMRANKIETPTLLLSALDEIPDKVKGLNVGADDYMTKPFSAAELVARINALTRRKGEVIVHDVAKYVPETEYVVKVIDRHVEKAKNNLKGAAIVIAGGYGMGSKEGFGMLYELAHELHAEVGGSRAAVDAGFCDHDLQIGQTGVTVRPKVYIACGISGAIQHIAGMKESGIIISVNSDPNAPINAIADYVINGTVEEVVPKLIKYYKQNSK